MMSTCIFLSSSELVRQYSVMYSKNRIDTLDSLNALPQLKHAHQLKAKILFSIIVVSCPVVDLFYPVRFLNNRECVFLFRSLPSVPATA